MRKLTDYLKANGMTQTALAASLGISQGYLSELLRGQKRMTLEIAHRIETLTGGAIPMQDWIAPDGSGRSDDKTKGAR